MAVQLLPMEPVVVVVDDNDNIVLLLLLLRSSLLLWEAKLQPWGCCFGNDRHDHDQCSHAAAWSPTSSCRCYYVAAANEMDELPSEIDGWHNEWYPNPQARGGGSISAVERALECILDGCLLVLLL